MLTQSLWTTTKMCSAEKIGQSPSTYNFFSRNMAEYCCGASKKSACDAHTATSDTTSTTSAACTADTKAMSECVAKLPTAVSDKSKMCSYYQDVFACYPACYCNMAAMKSTMDKSIKDFEDSLKALGVTCSLQCGMKTSSGTATPTSSTESASLKTCLTDGTVTPWPKEDTMHVSQCSCGSGVCYALGTCNTKGTTSETACTCEPSDTHFCFARKQWIDGASHEPITTVPVKYGCFDNKGGGSILIGCSDEGVDVVATRFTNSGCKEGDEIESTDDQKNPDILPAEWEVDAEATAKNADSGSSSSGSSSSGSDSSSGSSSTACTAAEATAMTDCAKKMGERASDMNDKEKMCPYFQDNFGCYPACTCNDPGMKSSIDKSIKSSQDGLETMGINDCSLTCGNTGGRRLLAGFERILAGTSERKSISTCFNGKMYTAEERAQAEADYNALNAANTKSISGVMVATVVGLIALM